MEILRKLKMYWFSKKKTLVNTKPSSSISATKSSFPLLRLPFVALSQFLKITTPNELITLSLCSEKALRFVRLCRDKSIDWDLELWGIDSPSLSFRMEKKSFEILKISKMSNDLKNHQVTKIGGMMIPISLANGILTVHLNEDDWIDGIKIVVNYMSDLFGKPVLYLYIEWENRWMVDFINGRQTERLKHGYLQNDVPVPEEEFPEIIEKFNPTLTLTLHIDASDTFRYTGRFCDADQIIVTYCGYWITIENILAMNSVFVGIYLSRLTGYHVNIFIKHWLAGGSPRLKYAQLSQRLDVTPEKVFEGLTDRVIEVQRVRKYRKPNGKIETILNGYDIRRDDGVVATINRGLIVVWPDLDGNHN